MRIGSHTISERHPAYIIAEIGMNHNGDIELARQHILRAAEAGVNAVKFQSFKVEKLLSREDNRFDQMKRYEFQDEWYAELQTLANSMQVDFLSTAFDCETMDLLEQIEVPCIKIASGDLNYIPLLEHAAKKKIPVLLSTGYSSIKELGNSYEIFKKAQCPVILLHCISAYPAPIEQMNLRTISYLQDTFSCHAGLSDHSLDSSIVPVAARALGACVFEKHFTIDTSLPGFDHSMSADPATMRQYVQSIRAAEQSLGIARNETFQCEFAKRDRARRGLYWNRSLSKGEAVSTNDIKIVRPAANMSPEKIYNVIGKRTVRAVNAEEPVSNDDF